MSKEFKDIFRQLLTENKISGKEAASLFRVSESTITYWSTGITIPRPSVYRRLPIISVCHLVT